MLDNVELMRSLGLMVAVGNKLCAVEQDNYHSVTCRLVLYPIPVLPVCYARTGACTYSSISTGIDVL